MRRAPRRRGPVPDHHRRHRDLLPARAIAAGRRFPVVLTHGWPGSPVEFLDVLDPLTEAGFHCVVPSLPGYGWSDKPREAGWGVDRIARAWAALMARLGYERYGAVGSDWGTSVSASLAQQDPQHAAGALLMPPLAPPLPDDGRAGREQADRRQRLFGRAAHPPADHRLLADRLARRSCRLDRREDRQWTDPRSRLKRDAVLDNLMHYWLPRTGASAARLYWESLATSPAGSVDRWSSVTSSTLRSAAASFPTNSNDPPGRKRSSASPTSATGTSPNSADISRRGSSLIVHPRGRGILHAPALTP